MAFASSIQIPVGCLLCEVGNKINWKCIQCDLLMCDRCKDGIHQRIANDHRIINIKNIGKQEESNKTTAFKDVNCEDHCNQSCCLYCDTCKKLICFKCITKVHKGHEFIEEDDYIKGKVEIMPKQLIKFEISKEYTTDLRHIHYIAVCSNGSMWMVDGLKSKLQNVKLRENRAEIIISLNTQIYGMAKSHSDDILAVTDETQLQLINTMTGEITDSRYDVKPLIVLSIHLTSDQRVIIGARSPGEPFPATGRRVVIAMDRKGQQLKTFEHNNHKKQLFPLPRFLTSTKHNKSLFTYPKYTTTTCNGNICVVDWLDWDHRSRVVVLSPRGDILGIYTGHPDVNDDNNPLIAHGILTTPSDKIVLTDVDNHLLHILTDQGQIITYYNLRDMGIIRPCSLALSSSGTIFIGCLIEKSSPETTKAKLYELEYSGF